MYSQEFWNELYREHEYDNWVWSRDDFTKFLPAFFGSVKPIAGEQPVRNVVELGYGTSDLFYLFYKQEGVLPQKPSSVTAVELSDVAHKRMLEHFPPESYPGLKFVQGDLKKFLKKQDKGSVDFLFESSTLDNVRVFADPAEVVTQVLQPAFESLHPEHGVYISGSYTAPKDTLEYFSMQPWDHVHICKKTEKSASTDTIYIMMRGSRTQTQSPYWLHENTFKCRDVTRRIHLRRQKQ
eukprot:TRINITY_DN105645_c0_g1_i1.p1 TRINITY_DN105645_c0_g1~~TRINITY_DN105645_c0_g1_i1.p1  ORF type:complete len:269 (+),score=49.30 TRINITY_DN105645_c0_g1_i1:96-809(+)